MREQQLSRRPIAARNTAWAAAAARFLAHQGIRPNVISIGSAVCGALGGLGFWAAGRSESPWTWCLCLIAAIAGMQLRLLCNLFDGMVAMEGGFKTKSGEVFNEVPDRFSDAFIFIGAGYALPTRAAFLPELGWLAAAVAITTAYVRAMGVAAGASQQFCGPMAKQQRMAMLTAGTVVAFGAPWWAPLDAAIPIALWIIVVGGMITVFRRTGRIIRELESR